MPQAAPQAANLVVVLLQDFVVSVSGTDHVHLTVLHLAQRTVRRGAELWDEVDHFQLLGLPGTHEAQLDGLRNPLIFPLHFPARVVVGPHADAVRVVSHNIQLRVQYERSILATLSIHQLLVTDDAARAHEGEGAYANNTTGCHIEGLGDGHDSCTRRLPNRPSRKPHAS